VLHDSLTPDQIVDAEAALEFMKEATKLATTSELEDIGQRLEAKSAVFVALLAPDAIDALDDAAFKRLTGMIFTVRRKANRLVKANGLDKIRRELAMLLYGSAPVSQRLDTFMGAVGGLEEAMILSLATESLHFSDPGRYWLWTHWIWSPKGPRSLEPDAQNPGSEQSGSKGSGALALVTQDDLELTPGSHGEIYEQVGRATAVINQQGHVAGYSRSGRGLFGTDVFLACVYAVFMYTVFRVKLSQEFNRILPELPELVQRVLGVQQLGETG
jgi:hypothetical protein